MTYNASRRTNDDVLAEAHVAQLAEHVLGKDEVTRSIRVVGSRVVKVKVQAEVEAAGFSSTLTST